MTGLLIAVAGGYGVYLLYTAVVLRWRGFGPAQGTTKVGPAWRRRAEQWLTQAGLVDVRVAEFAAVMAVLFVAGAAFAFALFGSVVPAMVVGGFAASYPLASYRARRQQARRRAAEAWPRMIEEIALLSGSLGRSVPQALFEVGSGAPPEMAPAFAAVISSIRQACSRCRTRLIDHPRVPVGDGLSCAVHDESRCSRPAHGPPRGSQLLDRALGGSDCRAGGAVPGAPRRYRALAEHCARLRA